MKKPIFFSLSLLLILISSNTYAVLDLSKISKKRSKITKKQFVIKILKKNISADKLKKWVNDQLFLMATETDPNPTPYRGHISQKIECPSKLIPSKLKLKSQNYVAGILYVSNDRYTKVNCSNDKIVYQSAILTFHCNNNQGYKIKVHHPYNKDTTQFMKFLEEIRCTHK